MWGSMTDGRVLGTGAACFQGRTTQDINLVWTENQNVLQCRRRRASGLLALAILIAHPFHVGFTGDALSCSLGARALEEGCTLLVVLCIGSAV